VLWTVVSKFLFIYSVHLKTLFRWWPWAIEKNLTADLVTIPITTNLLPTCKLNDLCWSSKSRAEVSSELSSWAVSSVFFSLDDELLFHECTAVSSFFFWRWAVTSWVYTYEGPVFLIRVVHELAHFGLRGLHVSMYVRITFRCTLFVFAKCQL
jgi:hypothetical protein